jgi:hypothetical protein
MKPKEDGSPLDFAVGVAMIAVTNLQTWGLVVLTPLAAVVGAYIAARPLSKTSRAEADARLLGLFVQIMRKAESRGESALADSTLQALVSSGRATPTTPEELSKWVQGAVANYPVGKSEQEAAIAAIGELGCRHPVLADAAEEGLRQIERGNKPTPDAVAATIAKLRQCRHRRLRRRALVRIAVLVLVLLVGGLLLWHSMAHGGGSNPKGSATPSALNSAPASPSAGH